MQGLNQGVVRMAAMDSHANGLLPGLIERLSHEHSAISLEAEIMSTDNAAGALVNGDVDVTAAYNLSPHREIVIVFSADLPFGCVVAPDHPLSRTRTTTMQNASGYPIALQSRSLMIRRYLDAKHGWILAQQKPPVVSNSLQLMKQLARSGNYIAFTSELDAAPELIEGTLKFIPIRDKAADPQSVSVAVNARRVSRIAQIVAGVLAEEIAASLRRIRSQPS
jgi:DNA-binding transcriptional LysR family regulator